MFLKCRKLEKHQQVPCPQDFVFQILLYSCPSASSSKMKWCGARGLSVTVNHYFIFPS